MIQIRNFAIEAVLGLSLAAGVIATVIAPSPAMAKPAFQSYGEDNGLRGLVDQTQTDLREAANLEHRGGKERERFDNAQHSLSTFDRHLTKNHFDKGQLDKVIGDIQSILDHNTLQAHDRDSLRHDVETLRVARERRGL